MVVVNAGLQFFITRRHIVEIHLHGEMEIRHRHRMVLDTELENLARELVRSGRFRTGNVAEVGEVDDGYLNGDVTIAESSENDEADGLEGSDSSRWERRM